MSKFLSGDWLPWFVWFNIRSLAVLIMAGIVLAIIRKRAPSSMSHLVATTACAALLALPLLTTLLPAYPAHIASPNSVLLRVTSGGPAAVDRSGVISLLFVVWIGGVLLRCGRIAIGWLGLRRLTLTSSPVKRGWLRDTFVQLAYGCDVFAPVHYRTADDPAFQTPVTWGHGRPVILLPSDDVLAGWPESRLRAVLQHEFAHIRRADWLTHQVAQLACALYWFNPLVTGLASRMEHLAEQACDDYVLLSGVDAPDYASHLLAVATAVRNSTFGGYRLSPIQAMALPKSKVEARVMSILGRAVRRTRVSGRMVASALLVVTFITLPLATVQLAARTIPPSSMPSILTTTIQPVAQGVSPTKPAHVAPPSGRDVETAGNVPVPSGVDGAVDEVPVEAASQSVSQALAPTVAQSEPVYTIVMAPNPASRVAQPVSTPVESKKPAVPQATTPSAAPQEDTSSNVPNDPFADYRPPLNAPPPAGPGFVSTPLNSNIRVYPDGTVVTGNVILPPNAYRNYPPSNDGSGTTGSTTTGSTTGFGTGSTTTGGTTSGVGTTGSSTAGSTTGSSTTGGTTSFSTTGGTSGG